MSYTNRKSNEMLEQQKKDNLPVISIYGLNHCSSEHEIMED